MSEFRFWADAPKVWVVGVTQPDPDAIQGYLDYRNLEWKRGPIDNPGSLIVFGGNVCYESFHNPKGATDASYIQNSIIDLDHGSVTEHVSVNLAVASLPRSSQLETVRHRAGCAYSFRSTRFADDWIEYICPPMFRDDPDAFEVFYRTCKFVHDSYNLLSKMVKTDPLGENVAATLKRKRIKEASRSVLENCVGSDGLITLNGRALRHIVAMRTDEHADASIREFAWAVYQATKGVLPFLYQDAEEVPVDFGPPIVKFAHPKI